MQLLICPSTDLGNSGASPRQHGIGFGLDTAGIEWFNSQWVPEPAMITHPRVSLLFVPDLTGLPAQSSSPANAIQFVTKGEAYAARLRDAGVLTTARHEKGMVHNFIALGPISPACSAAPIASPTTSQHRYCPTLRKQRRSK